MEKGAKTISFIDHSSLVIPPIELKMAPAPEPRELEIREHEPIFIDIEAPSNWALNVSILLLVIADIILKFLPVG